MKTIWIVNNFKFPYVRRITKSFKKVIIFQINLFKKVFMF